MHDPRRTFSQSILEAQSSALRDDPSVILIGEGVPDPKCVFGTTKGLRELYPKQVFDMPVSEAGMTGIMIGASLNGLKPIMTHQRMDFSLYAMDQIINNAAKWYSMFGGQRSIPLTIRMIIGRGWGQGNQHSQNLSALYAHIPGLKVFMPSTPQSAYRLLTQAIKDPNPCIFLENKWLYNSTGYSDNYYWPIGKDLTIVSWGHALHEVLLALEYSPQIDATVIDMDTLRPIDWAPILVSVRQTGKLLVVEDAWRTGSISAEVIATVVEQVNLTSPPIRLNYPDFPSPSSHALTKHYYKGPIEIMMAIAELTTQELDWIGINKYMQTRTHDVDPFTNKFTSAL